MNKKIDYKSELKRDKPKICFSQINLQKPIQLPMAREDLEKLDYDQLFLILKQAHIKNQIDKEFYIDLIEKCGGVDV